MKGYLILLFTLFLFTAAFSQIEKDNYKKISSKFVANFNENKIDSIVAMFSPAI